MSGADRRPHADVLYGPMIHERFAERFEGWLGSSATTTRSTVPARAGSRREPARGLRRRPGGGLFYHPTLVVGVTADDDLYSTETFGPIVGVASSRLRRGDRAGQRPRLRLVLVDLHHARATNAFRFRERITAGMVSVNNSTSGAEAHLPFGGNGKSGNGSRQSGIWVLDQFTRWQSMNWDYAGKLQKAQMDVVDLPGDPGFHLT